MVYTIGDVMVENFLLYCLDRDISDYSIGIKGQQEFYSGHESYYDRDYGLKEVHEPNNIKFLMRYI